MIRRSCKADNRNTKYEHARSQKCKQVNKNKTGASVVWQNANPFATSTAYTFPITNKSMSKGKGPQKSFRTSRKVSEFLCFYKSRNMTNDW